MLRDEESGDGKVASRMRMNMTHFAYVLSLKARNRIRKGDRDQAMKVLFKLNRLIISKVLAPKEI